MYSENHISPYDMQLDFPTPFHNLTFVSYSIMGTTIANGVQVCDSENEVLQLRGEDFIGGFLHKCLLYGILHNWVWQPLWIGGYYRAYITSGAIWNAEALATTL